MIWDRNLFSFSIFKNRCRFDEPNLTFNDANKLLQAPSSFKCAQYKRKRTWTRCLKNNYLEFVFTGSQVFVELVPDQTSAVLLLVAGIAQPPNEGVRWVTAVALETYGFKQDVSLAEFND